MPGYVDLAFTDSHGGDETVTFAMKLPAEAAEAALCARSLGSALPALEAAARKQLADDSMSLQSITCRNIHNNWVKLVRRIPIAWAPQVQ